MNARIRRIAGLVAVHLAIVGVPIVSPAAECVQWENRAGQRILAEFIAVEGDRIRLRVQPSGRVYEFGLGELSDAHQALARQLAGAAPPPSAAAPTTAPAVEPAARAPAAAAAPGQWPRTVTVGTAVAVETVEENEAERRFVYRTDHFEFQCDARLGENVVREFARLFEATHALVKALPFGFDPKPPGDRFLARLFVSKEDFEKAGGMPGSGGTYRGRERDILVPLSSLGVKRVGKRYTIEDREDNGPLIHELTHQLLHEWNAILPVWLTEGWAELIASVKYSMGRYTLSGGGDRVIDALRRHRGADGARFALVPLKQLMELSHRVWGEYVGDESLGRDSSRNYASALLVAHHMARVDDGGTGAHLRAYMQAIKERVPEPEARAPHLLRGRTLDQLEAEIVKDWRKEGLALEVLPLSKWLGTDTDTGAAGGGEAR